MLVVFTRPINREVSKGLEHLQQRGLRGVPGNSTQKHAGGVGRVLVSPRGQLTAPGTNDHRSWGNTNEIDFF